MRKTILFVLLLVGVLALQGCAIVYFEETKTSKLTASEFGVLGFLPLWRSSTVHDPKEPVAKKTPCTIFVSKNGEVTLDTKKVTLENLLSEMNAMGVNPEETITLKADRETRDDSFMKVLDKLAKGKYTKINFSTK